MDGNTQQQTLNGANSFDFTEDNDFLSPPVVAEEARRRGVIPRHLSPKAVQAFFEDLLPLSSEATGDNNDDVDFIDLCNEVVEDNLTKDSENSPPSPLPPTTTIVKNKPFSDAQMEHIRKYRSEIDSSTCAAFLEDWRNVMLKKPTIGPARKKVQPTDYYIRPSAVLVPHLIIDNYLSLLLLETSGDLKNDMIKQG